MEIISDSVVGSGKVDNSNHMTTAQARVDAKSIKDTVAGKGLNGPYSSVKDMMEALDA